MSLTNEQIVDAIADHWGVEEASGGKRVWFVLGPDGA